MDNQYIDASPDTVSEASNKFKSHAQKRDVISLYASTNMLLSEWIIDILMFHQIQFLKL